MSRRVYVVEIFWHSRFLHRGLDELGQFLKSYEQLAPTDIMHFFTELTPSSAKMSVVSHGTACTAWSVHATFATNPSILVGPLFRVGCTSCPILIPVVRGIVGDLDGRLNLGFDLPLLLLSSSPSKSWDRSHSGILVHFHHSTNRTSWFYDSLWARRALFEDLPWMLMQG